MPQETLKARGITHSYDKENMFIIDLKYYTINPIFTH